MPRLASDCDQIIDYTLRSHQSKTRLIVILNLKATLGIICTSLHNRRLSDYRLSLPPHTVCYYIQTRHGERGKVGSSESVAAAVCCVGCCSSCRHLLDRVQSLLHIGLQICTSEYLTPDYRMIKAEPTRPSTGQPTDGDGPSLRTDITLTAEWPTRRAWPTVLH